MTTWTLDPAHTQIILLRQAHDGHDRPRQVPRRRRHDRPRRGRSDPLARRVPGRGRRASTRSSAARDDHLRSADFFDAERFPIITFRSTAVEATGGDDYRVTGDLTIRDVTHPATFDVELDGIVPGHARRPPRRPVGDDEDPARRLGPRTGTSPSSRAAGSSARRSSSRSRSRPMRSRRRSRPRRWGPRHSPSSSSGIRLRRANVEISFAGGRASVRPPPRR